MFNTPLQLPCVFAVCAVYSLKAELKAHAGCYLTVENWSAIPSLLKEKFGRALLLTFQNIFET